jgi:hypothetical protein
LSHSEIHGSKLVRSSPWLIAAYHVLHRLLPPRHPPNALKSLDRSHYQCSPLGRGRPARRPVSRALTKRPDHSEKNPASARLRPMAIWLPLTRARQIPFSRFFSLTGAKLPPGDRVSETCSSSRNRTAWWSLPGSNRRPEACKATALPAELRPRHSVQLPHHCDILLVLPPAGPLQRNFHNGGPG